MSFASNLISKCGEYTNFAIYGVAVPYLDGAKNTPAEILQAINNWRGSDPKTIAEIQAWMNSHKSQTGIDCSGLAYYVLNEASGGVVRTYFEQQLGISLPYSYGISTANLSSTTYGTIKTAAKDMTPGCTIRSDNGGHVLVIHTVNKNSNGVVTSIYYSHSNGSMGPHSGIITVGNENQDLDGSAQTWSDSAYTSAEAKGLYTHTILLNCL
jgi:hypothetical protein